MPIRSISQMDDFPLHTEHLHQLSLHPTRCSVIAQKPIDLNFIIGKKMP